jgi:hypothetical protein
MKGCVGVAVSVETRRVFISRIKYAFIARVGRIKGVICGSKVNTENKS